MKKLVYTLSLMGALVVGANADVTKVTPANTDAEGCYLIGSAGELLGFAEIVNNGIPNAENPEEYDTDPQPGVCGKLTGNISFLDRTLLNEDLTGFNGDLAPAANNWTPMENFSGKFDGQGYTISGLFYGGTDVTNAGFFESLSGNAIVKNLRLEDFYMEANENIGGFAAIIKSGANVTIERCTSSGVITSTQNTNSVFAGGFIGILEEGTTDKKTLLTITNSSSEGNVNVGGNVLRGGIIGSPNNNSLVTLKNCFVTALVGGKYEQGVTGVYEKNSNSFENNSSVSCVGTGNVCNDKYYCKIDQTSCRDDKTKNPLTFNEVLSRIEKNYEIGLSNDIKEKGFKGLSIQYGSHPETGRKIVIAHITENDASRDDNVLQELVIPEDFPADSVDFDRPFKGNSSTVMIPFDIAAANVTNYDGDNVLLGSVESISCKNDEVKECEATAANAQAQIEAHTPYLVSAFDVNQEMEPIGNIPVGQTIHFHGPVVLKKNKADDSYKVSVGDDWSLVGTYKTLITTSSEDAESDYEKVSMLGKIFGFVGTAEISDGEGDNKHDFTLGEFARAGHNVRTREMRSYLIYSVPNPSPEPSINGMQRMAALSTEGEVELPSSIPVTFESRPIIPVPAFVDTTVKPTTMVQVIMPSYSDEECDSEEGECEEEGTAAIAKPFISPLKSNKVDRWQDAMGRSLNGKPTKHGTYFKNGIPVIIK